MEFHFATHKHSAAAVTVRAFSRKAQLSDLARAVAFTAQGNFLRFAHFLDHTVVSSFLGST